MMKLLRLSLGIPLAFASLAVAQPLSFEVASIKAVPAATPGTAIGDQPRVGTRIDAGQANFTSFPLRDLIDSAYRIRPFQLLGPDWMRNSRFDILAKLPEGATRDQVPEMLQTLLAERFKLTVHRESKEFPVYALVAGKDGPKLTPKPADYDRAVKSKLIPLTLEGLATQLAAQSDKPVIDQTGLEGEYMIPADDILREQFRVSSQRARAIRAGEVPDPIGSNPSVADILKALGLKMEPSKIAMPVIVVDHIEKTPTDN